MSVEIGDLFNARPLPRGEGESFAASFANQRLDSRAAITNYRESSQAVPSPASRHSEATADGGEGQGEGGRPTLQSEPPHVGCYKSR